MNEYQEILAVKPDQAMVAAIRQNAQFQEMVRQTPTGDLKLDSLDTSAYYLAQMLTHIKSRALEVKTPELTARKIFPVSRDTPVGAIKTGYEVTEYIGETAVMANRANDIPRVDVKTDWIEVKIKNVANSFGYSWRDLRAAQFSRQPLRDRLARASQKSIEEKLNAIAWAGDTEHNIKGVLSDGTGIVTKPMPGTLESFATAKLLNRAITAEIAGIHIRSRGVFSADTWAVDLESYEYLFNEIWDGTELKSIGKFLLENNRHLKRIVPAPELMADSPLNRFKARASVLFEYGVDNMAIEVPMSPTMRPPHTILTGIEIMNEAETGGMFVKQPASAVILTGL